MNHARKILAAAAAFIYAVPRVVHADIGSWTALITSSDFTGIKTDVLTTVSGILLIALIILGLGLLLKVFR